MGDLKSSGTDYIGLLSNGFKESVSVREKRPGTMKLIVPLFHEDGDMIDIFLETLPSGLVRVSDKGLTVMRMPHRDVGDKHHQTIINENGELYMDVWPDKLFPTVLNFALAVARITI